MDTKSRARKRPANTPTPPERLDAEATTAPADIQRMLVKAKRISPRLYALLTAKPIEDTENAKPAA